MHSYFPLELCPFVCTYGSWNRACLFCVRDSRPNIENTCPHLLGTPSAGFLMACDYCLIQISDSNEVHENSVFGGYSTRDHVELLECPTSVLAAVHASVRTISYG